MCVIFFPVSWNATRDILEYQKWKSRARTTLGYEQSSVGFDHKISPIAVCSDNSTLVFQWIKHKQIQSQDSVQSCLLFQRKEFIY